MIIDNVSLQIFVRFDVELLSSRMSFTSNVTGKDYQRPEETVKSIFHGWKNAISKVFDGEYGSHHFRDHYASKAIQAQGVEGQQTT